MWARECIKSNAGIKIPEICLQACRHTHTHKYTHTHAFTIAEGVKIVTARECRVNLHAKRGPKESQPGH